jgi:two-component system phosphate regulon sensor histidine kinase PhoR
VRPGQLRSAGWRALWRHALLLAAATAVGWLSGTPWVALCLVLAGMLLWHGRQMAALFEALERRRWLPPGDPWGIWGALRRELRDRQQATRRRQRRLNTMLLAFRRAATVTPDGALIVERDDLRVRWFNKAAKRLLGLRYPQDVDRPLEELVRLPAVSAWLRDPQAEDLLSDLASPHDPAVRLSLRRVSYTERDWLLVLRDVTQLMRLEHLRRDFVANVSHELRTPLTVVHGYLEMMDPREHPEWGPMIEQMRLQSQRMTQLVEDLLTLSRLEAQTEQLDETIHMQALLATLLREAQALSQGRHRIRVENRAGCDLRGAPRELHSALSNLVSNAVRYTPQDGSVFIRWELTAEGEPAFRVQDSGYGIAASHLPRITERFYRVSTSRSRESGGTGLGLAIVKHVLNLHQARFEVESEVGRGSVFGAVFPATRRIDAAESAE